MGDVDVSALAGRVFRAVLFDLDGTLVDSTPAVERSWRTLAEEFGKPLDFGTFHGVPARQAVPHVIGAENLEAGVARLAELEIADTEGVVALPGATEALAATADRSAIATSCTRPLADVRIAAGGLVPPAVLVTAEETPLGKPDPAPWLLATRRLGVEPGECLVVEDAPAGLAAARAAGAATLAVQTTHPAAELDADAWIGTLADVRFVPDGEGVRVVAAGADDRRVSSRA